MRGEVCVVVLLGVVGSIGCSTEHGKSLDLVHENDVSGLEIDEPQRSLMRQPHLTRLTHKEQHSARSRSRRRISVRTIHVGEW